MNKRTVIGLMAALALSFSVSAFQPSFAAEESSQVLMLRKVFATAVEGWEDILRANTKLLDKSFFERVESRIKWSIDNGQVEDAVRFAYVGDLAGNIVNHKTNYRMQMSQLFRKLGNMPMALDLINNVCIMEPDNKEALFYQASLMQDAGSHIDCYPIYQKLAEDGYKRDECYYRMALLELERSEIETAREHLKQAVKINSHHEPAKKKLDQIERALAQATFVPTENNLASGIPVSSNGQFPIAASNSSKAMSFAMEGDAALKEGSISKAKELYSKALTADPKSAQGLMGRGIVAYREGDLEGAIASFEAASQRFLNGNANLERYLGSCYEFRYDSLKDKGDLDKARACYQRCKDLDANNEFVEADLMRVSQKFIEKN
ncbi:tetratricopeptide repeat protein [bacterium]|nr:tetratricopeptide repeat protein [bacterium]